MKLIEIAEAVADEITGPRPDSFDPIEMTPEVMTLLRTINKAGDFIAKTIDLNFLLKDFSVRASYEYPTIPANLIPDDFLRFKRGTFRDDSDFYIGPLDYSDFLRVKKNDFDKCFAYYANNVVVSPKIGNELSFAYYHDKWAKGIRRQGGDDIEIELNHLKENDDEAIIDSALIIAYAKYFMLLSLGMDATTAQEEAKYVKAHTVLTEETETTPFYKYPSTATRYEFGM